MKSLPRYFFQLGVLSLVMVGSWLGLLSLSSEQLNIDPTQALSPLEFISFLLIVCIVHTILTTVLFEQAAWKGFKLFIAFFAIMFGIQFLLTQLEAYFYHGPMPLPESIIYGVLGAGAALTAIYSFAAIIVTGRHRLRIAERYFKSPNENRKYSWKVIVRALFAALVLYPVIYFLADYFILLQFEEARQYYSGSNNLLPFVAHMKNVFSSGNLYFLQATRGILWVVIGAILYKMLKSHITIKALLIAFTFTLFMGMQLLIPNPYMPSGVRYAHLLELLPSNFLWGIILVLYVYRPRRRKSLY